MKKYSKVLALVLATALVFGAAGCGKQEETPAAGDDATASTEAATTEEASKEDVTATEEATEGEATHISYAYWGTPDEAASVQEVADKYHEENPNIIVDIMCIPNEEYVAKLNTLATAEELPDCGIMSEAGVLDFGSKGLLADISNMYAGADAAPLDCITFKADGKPVAYSAANEILVLYYNKDLFDAAGVEYPSATEAMSWDEFIKISQLLTLDTNGKNATEDGFDANNIVQYGCTVDNWTWQLEVWALSNGGRWFSEDGKECTINSPEVAESIQNVADLMNKYHVMPYRAGLTDDGVQSTICAGNIAMSTGGAWNMGTCLNGVDFNYGVARLPMMKESVTICTGGPQVVFSQSEHPEEAMEFIKWYMKEENSWDSLIATGIWMPILEKYYTDTELTNKWIDNPNFPEHEECVGALVNYAMDNAKSTCWYYTPHTNEFIELLRAALGDVWTGDQTAAEALEANYDSLNAILNQ
ncbi:MAG TPA: sugar ABC transporter substrate-binding protein [Lachnospiraceae bacterium]|nr:sugar ABC transporter substrate-binding protein [Lachnospiraceae bacterium]